MGDVGRRVCVDVSPLWAGPELSRRLTGSKFDFQKTAALFREAATLSVPRSGVLMVRTLGLCIDGWGVSLWLRGLPPALHGSSISWLGGRGFPCC